MKNITIIILMLFASLSFAQNQPIDFEPGGYGYDWTWTVFENLTNPPLEIIANPDQSGINTSATVAKFTALEGGNPWAGVESQQGVDLGTFQWNDDNRIVKIHVWKPVISDVGIKFATETGWAEPEILVSNTVTNQWEELTFDFSNAINPPDGNGTLGQIIIFPDFDNREQDNVVYFDNITFGSGDDDPPPADGPEVAAPTPPALDPDDVISIFSDAFTDVEGTDFNPDWGQSTQVSIIDIEGSSTLKYANFNYQGTQFAGSLDVSEMEYLHLHMWTADATSVNVFCISEGPVETGFALPITPNQWISYDIPLSAFDPVDMTDIIQLKFDGGDGTQTIYLDNIYFHAVEPEEGTDATLSDLQVGGTTVAGFAPTILNYSVVLPEGTTEVPTVTATTTDPDASAVITPADAIPGTTSILVTSANTEVELTYTVEFSIETEDTEPTVAAPTPPARNPEDVISIFSDAYENVPDTDFFPWWDQTTEPSIIEIEGSQTLKYANFNYQGIQLADAIDISEMEYLHLDMWTADATSVNVFCISTGPVETPFALPITPNEWVSYDIPLTEFDPVDLTDLIQFKFDGGDGTQTIYLDNLYFFRLPTSVSEIGYEGLTVYPNPVRSGELVQLSMQAEMVEVFDISGKLMQSFFNISSVPTDRLNRGVYLMRIQSENGHVRISRLVVK